MVASFGPESPILYYSPRPHANPGKRNERVYVIWPAWSYHVIAPVMEHQQLNELQQAILGVLQASRLTAIELGDCLGIHPELAAFVVTEMQEQCWVDPGWAVTLLGRNLLEKEVEMESSLVSGWVFKDPWQENLWPFVATSLEFARVGLDSNDRQALDLGSSERPWLQQPWKVNPVGQLAPSPPSTNEILRAVLLQERLKNNVTSIEFQVHEGLDSGGISGLDLKRICSLDPVPEPIFLTSFLYVPQDGEDKDLDWHACDFFGRGSDSTLRGYVAREAGEDPKFAARLSWLLGNTLLYQDFSDYRQMEANRKEKAKRLLQLALTGRVNEFSVAMPLVEMLEAWTELSYLEKEGLAGQRHGRSVLLACRGALERLFGDIANSWPLTGIPASRYHQDVNVVALKNAAEDIGLTALPETLQSIPHHQIQGVIRKTQQQIWRLRPLVAATLLRAGTEEKHPLRTAARRAPDILSRIDEVAKSGGEAAHRYNNNFDFSIVGETVRETIEIVGLLLELQVGNLMEILQDAK